MVGHILGSGLFIDKVSIFGLSFSRSNSTSFMLGPFPITTSTLPLPMPFMSRIFGMLSGGVSLNAYVIVAGAFGLLVFVVLFTKLLSITALFLTGWITFWIFMLVDCLYEFSGHQEAQT